MCCISSHLNFPWRSSFAVTFARPIVKIKMTHFLWLTCVRYFIFRALNAGDVDIADAFTVCGCEYAAVYQPMIQRQRCTIIVRLRITCIGRLSP